MRMEVGKQFEGDNKHWGSLRCPLTISDVIRQENRQLDLGLGQARLNAKRQ